MKIVVNSQSDDLIHEFLKLSKNNNVELINADTEKFLFDCISAGDVSAFIIDKSTYSQRAIDFLKKKHPYIPSLIIGKQEINVINDADVYIPSIKDLPYFYSVLMKNVSSYEKNFRSLQRLTNKQLGKIEFRKFTYDPNVRTLYGEDGKFISKFSEKAGGIFQILTSNYGKLVKKEFILEKVWLKSDYFSSRSMDVYITNIRKVFRANNMDIKIRNVSKTGLILE